MFCLCSFIWKASPGYLVSNFYVEILILALHFLWSIYLFYFIAILHFLVPHIRDPNPVVIMEHKMAKIKVPMNTFSSSAHSSISYILLELEKAFSSSYPASELVGELAD